MKRLLACCLVLAVTTAAHADIPADSGVAMAALEDELARALTMELPGMQKPYYAALEISDQEYLMVGSSLGAIVQDSLLRRLRLGARARVGEYANDSGNVQDDAPWSHHDESERQTALDASYDNVRHDAWLALDASYKSALDAFAKKSAIRAGEEASSDRVDDFSHETPTVMIDPRLPKPIDHAQATRLARALSAIGNEHPTLRGASALVQVTRTQRYFASSEGARVVEPRFSALVYAGFRAQADDGMVLSDYRSVTTCSSEMFPAEESILADARAAATELEEIRRASIVEDYSGPILFEGVAAPALLADVLRRSVGGTPVPLASESAYNRGRDTELSGQVGQRVFPSGFRLQDDPTIDRLGSLPLAGCYKVDEEGVPAQKITLVDDGIFKTFLMSRTPRKGFPHSNGHAREAYDGIKASVGNLILSTTKGVSSKELRTRLIAEAKLQKKPYALVIQRFASSGISDVDVSRASMISSRGHGGETALVMWKVGLDGKETRVRGGELAPVSLRTLKEILAAGTTPAATGYAGTGGYSIVSPALLFKDLEVKKPSDPSKHPSVLPRPD